MLQKIENGGRFPWQHMLVGRTARYHVGRVCHTLYHRPLTPRSGAREPHFEVLVNHESSVTRY